MSIDKFELIFPRIIHVRKEKISFPDLSVQVQGEPAENVYGLKFEIPVSLVGRHSIGQPGLLLLQFECPASCCAGEILPPFPPLHSGSA